MLHARVEQRQKELAETEKPGAIIKSLRGVNVEAIVPNRVKWPHEYILLGSAYERVQYDQLFTTTGFCRIMKDEANLETRQPILDYVMMDDVN